MEKKVSKNNWVKEIMSKGLDYTPIEDTELFKIIKAENDITGSPRMIATIVREFIRDLLTAQRREVEREAKIQENNKVVNRMKSLARKWRDKEKTDRVFGIIDCQRVIEDRISELKTNE